MSIITHIEHFLGQIGDGWKLIEPGYEVNVASFRDKPFEGAITYVTLGLSHHVLAMNPEESVRQELVFTTYEKYSGGEIASFLITFSDFILSKHQALLRGDVVGPGESIIPGCPLKAVYSSMPAVFDDGFAVYKGTSPPTVLVWIIPIHVSEVEFVKKNGWSRFEDILEDLDPDLFDLDRDPVV